jgi:ribosomal-protein-alanine N-acetyltransferase
MNTILETDRLLLRSWTADDAQAAFALYRDPEVTRFLGGPLGSLDEAREILKRIIDHYDRVGFGQWAVVEKKSGEIIGSCGVKLLDGGPEVELVYHLARASWNRGYATEAARACLDHGFTKLGLDRIRGIADPANHASHRVLEKIGMIYDRMGRYYKREVMVYVKDRPGAGQIVPAS